MRQDSGLELRCSEVRALVLYHAVIYHDTMVRTRGPAHDAPLSEQLFQILLSLVDEPRHGYGIIQDVASRTGVTLGAGTLYSAIKRIRAWGWVEEVRPSGSRDPRRRYYGLTGEGRRA